MPTLKEAKSKVHELSKRGLEIAESQTMTFAEQKNALDPIEVEIKKWMDEIEALEYVEQRRKSFMEATGVDIVDAGADSGADGGQVKSLGRQFAESDGYKNLIQRGLKGSNWSSGDVELKTLLAEGTAAAPGGGYAGVQTPTVLPGIVGIRFQPLTIADLFPNGSTTTPLIRYLIESAVTNAATAVAEGALKPESALAFTKADETLHKIATFLPVTDEMLEDFDQIQSYIDGRLSLFVRQAEEVQLLSGDGTGANLVGLLNRAGLAPTIVKGTAPSVAADNDMDVIYRQITAIRTTSWLEPDAIVIDPTAWQTILLSKNAQGQYYANGPFANAEQPALWGRKVVTTVRMAAGTALVGAFEQGGQIFRKGGLTVEASNSHADFFQKNLTAIRAEERIALAVYRPSAFGQVTGL